MKVERTNLHLLIGRSDEMVGQWEARVVELDLVTYAPSFTEAVRMAEGAVMTSITAAIDEGFDPFTPSRPVPVEFVTLAHTIVNHGEVLMQHQFQAAAEDPGAVFVTQLPVEVVKVPSRAALPRGRTAPKQEPIRTPQVIPFGWQSHAAVG